MGFFSTAQRALAAGETVYFARLVFFDFEDGAEYVWEGSGPLVVDGHTWTGAGELGSISDSGFGTDDSADYDTYQLSGVSPRMVELARSAAPVRGRPVIRYGHFFDAAWQPIDDMIVLKKSIMDRITYAGTGPTDRRITLTAESIWVTRNKAAYAFFSDRDQQIRFPGDLGLEYMPTLVNKKIAWPFGGGGGE